MIKKILALSLGILLIAGTVYAAGTCTVATKEVKGQFVDAKGVDIIFTCTGIDLTKDVPADALDKIQGMYLYRVVTVNTTAQVDCDADTDVYFKTDLGTDLISGTGVDALDNDAENWVRPTYIEFVSSAMGTPYLEIDNQTAATSVYTVTLVFIAEPGGGK